jgi:hypothetical protein
MQNACLAQAFNVAIAIVNKNQLHCHKIPGVAGIQGGSKSGKDSLYNKPHSRIMSTPAIITQQVMTKM